MTALQKAVISPKQPILTKKAALSSSLCTWFVFRVSMRALPALLNWLWIESIPGCPGNVVLLCYSAGPRGQSRPCCIQLGSGQGSWDAPEGLPPVHRISWCSYLLVSCRSTRENQDKLTPGTSWKDSNKRCKNEKLGDKIETGNYNLPTNPSCSRNILWETSHQACHMDRHPVLFSSRPRFTMNSRTGSQDCKDSLNHPPYS